MNTATRDDGVIMATQIQRRIDYYVNFAMRHGVRKVIETLLNIIDELNNAAENKARPTGSK